MTRIRNFIKKTKGRLNYYLVKFGLFGYNKKWSKVNLCGGGFKINNYCDVDLYFDADINMDLEKKILPFNDSSMGTVVCISAINYFDRERGEEIVRDIYRVLKTGGVARFASRDLKMIAKKYVNEDKAFFFQKLSDGRERFPGRTMADKINSWFYGYKTTGDKRCKYFYDYETLASIFEDVGFSRVDRKNFTESVIPEIEKIDNRSDQMFFLEAIK